jgi:Flp pilus assembly protein TadG
MKSVVMIRRELSRNSSGQALVETALILPLLLTIVLNAVNFAFFFLMALNITSASHTSGIYSIMGGATPAAGALPKAGPSTTTSTVSYLALQDLTGAVYSPTTSNTGVNVCSSVVGVSGSGSATKTTCTKTGVGGGFPTSADSDPEAPSFLLGRVDVAYKFHTPIPLTPFNAFLLLASNCNSVVGTVTCTFYRHVEMREMQ